MQQPKRILICPLDWGLGHATRCIPVIRYLLKKEQKVIIAADGRPLELLKQEFPELQFITFKGYGIKYPSSGNMVLKMLFSVPKIIGGIKREHKELEKIITEHAIDVVISDNRYGCFNKNVKSIFITHQLMIKAPFGEKILHGIISSYITKFDECWIPDFSGDDNLSGDLSHKYPLPDNAHFVGPLSRFNYQPQGTFLYDVVAVVSGPEPQRSIFERLVSEQIYRNNCKALIVFGVPEGTKKIEKKGNVTMVNHLTSKDMEQAIRNAAVIISRSGYSTIMDLAVLGKKAIFIPTPGQTEQEYLAAHFMKKKAVYHEKQSSFDLAGALKKSEDYKGFENTETTVLLAERIEAMLSGA